MREQDKAKLGEYFKIVKSTNQFQTKKEVQPFRLGLYGEVGSIMSAIKKLKREDRAFAGYKMKVVEEFGDAFWYLSALSISTQVPLEKLIASVCSENNFLFESKSKIDTGTPLALLPPDEGSMCNRNLVEVGRVASELLGSTGNYTSSQEQLYTVFLQSYFFLMDECGVCFNEVLDFNIKKVNSMFGPKQLDECLNFDKGFSKYERLPWTFEIEVRERTYGKKGRVYTRMGDVFIGNPLTDNISIADGFRYHDVIHLAHAAILHWSPTFRGLLKRKRKSNFDIDESEDGGRARVVEEGLTALVFAKAKELEYFNNQEVVSYDLLKTIQEFVEGYEVDKCPLWLWQSCILQGYEAFRYVKANNGGMIIGNRGDRTLKYKELPPEELT